MSITAHLCFIYAILAMMAGTMFFDSIDSTHIHSKQIASIQNYFMENLIPVFDDKYVTNGKLAFLRKDIFVDVMKEIKTMGLIPDTTLKSTETLDVLPDKSLIHETNMLDIHSGFVSMSDNMMADKDKEQYTSKPKSKQKLSSKRNNNTPTALSYIDTSSNHQKDLNTKQHDLDISLESSTQILQQLSIKESNERKLEESNLMCNGTLFTVEIQLDDWPTDNSWELIDVKTNDIIANVNYEEAGQFEVVHKEICVEPGPYIFTLYDFYEDGIHCGLSSCYNISIDNILVIQGSTFQDQISHHHMLATSSLCLIDSTFFLELNIHHNNSEFHPYLRNEVTGDTFNLIETRIQNDNYTNTFYACLLPGIYVLDELHVFDFPTSGCGLSDCFQVSINNEVIANSNDFLSLVQFGFAISNDFIAGQQYCHRSPFLSFIDSVYDFPWNNQTSHIMNDIRSLSSHEALSNIYTPQYKAACWLLFDDITKASVEEELTLERYVLGVLLYSTNQYAEMMLSGHYCDLVGVFCDDMGHVVEINWGGREISGIIPSEISYLRFLEILDLSDNQVEGTLPSELGRLDHLKVLRLDNNFITGTIPTEIGRLSNLEDLLLDENNVDGSIPSELSKCSNLEVLWLDNNDLSGTIPSELFLLRQMTEFLLYDNKLEGSIPSNIHQLKQLEWIWLNNNHFVGTIPAGMSELSTLKQIQFQNNGLTGAVPSIFADLQNLQFLWLHNNKLSGPLPDVFDTMPSLVDVDFSNNTLIGSLPDSMGTLPSLRTVNLSYNPFTGSIPATFCSLNLTVMKIQSTKITGTVLEECCGSLLLSRGNGWFVEETIQCSCCHDGVECYIWRVDDNVEEVTNYHPCPTNNVYVFDYFWAYKITDKILDQWVNNRETQDFHNEQLCLSPTGCYQISNFEIETFFWNHDASSMSLLRQEEDQFDQCNTIHICDITFNSTHPHRPKLNHITQLAVPNMTTLHDTSSPYHDALCWILTEDDYLDVHEICDGTLLQRYVMALFYISQNTTFTFDDFSNSTTCDWPGIACDSSNTFIHSLTFSNLTGSLITEIGLLQSLEVLDLSSSNLTGSLITEIGHLVNLQTLDLSNNSLDGSIGSSIFTNVPKLSLFNISNNNIEGQIPKEIFDPRNLRQIILADNILVNTLPDNIVCSDSIDYFNVHNNLLRGSIPTALFGCKSLVHIDLSRNGFTGVIPANIGDSNKLQVIQLSENKISGSIPVDLFKATDIRELMLQSNELTGSIPTEVGNLVHATKIILNHNSFKALIPDELKNLKNLKFLHIHHNQLTGTVPQMSFHNISRDTFISDCGNPSFLLGEAVECESCTMCCNSDDVCQENRPWKLSTPSLSIISSIVIPIGVAMIIFIIMKATKESRLGRFVEERDILNDYSADSVYCFVFTNSLVAKLIYFMTAFTQISLFAAYLEASSLDFFFSSNAYPFICPDNTFECEQINSNSVGIFGWIMFFVVTVLYLAKDLGMSVIQIAKGTTLMDYRLMISGLVLLMLTVLAAFTSYVYNAASVETNADLITNAVILFFINDIDERVMSALNILAPGWTENRVDEIKRNMLIKDDTCNSRLQPIENRIDLLETKKNDKATL